MVSFCKMLCMVSIFVNSGATCRADTRVCLLNVKKMGIKQKQLQQKIDSQSRTRRKHRINNNIKTLRKNCLCRHVTVSYGGTIFSVIVVISGALLSLIKIIMMKD